MKNDNSIKEAETLLEIIKSKIKDKSLKLFVHDYKRKYVEARVLREYNDFTIIDELCSIERYTSDIFGKENTGLNRDGWEFKIVGRYRGAIDERTVEKKFTTWFKNRHKNYGTLVHESGWNCSPYLNVNNLGIEFDVPRRVLIEDWVEPHEMLNKL
jgi:hypothetical protein